MTSTNTHLINSRSLSTLHSIGDELVLDKTKNYLFDLSYLAVLDVIGDKAADFLQGQLTCDLNQLSDVTMVQGALCNLKGRVLSLMDIINWEGIKLILPLDLIEQTQQSLIKSAMLSRVQIQSNSKLKVFGFYLQNVEDLLPLSDFFPNKDFSFVSTSSYCYYHLGKGFYLFIIDSADTEFLQSFAKKDHLLGSLTWHSLMIKQGYFSIYPESRGLFLPHRLGLHLKTVISFNKGCYKGQEIIARMHYKSTVKHEMRLFELQTSGKIFSGQKVMSPSDNVEVGELVDYSLIGDNSYLVAISMLKGIGSEVLLEGLKAPILLHNLH